MIDAIGAAMDRDEMEATHSAYDMYNAISRVATHDFELSDRQQRTLSRMAGELSQQSARQCDSCGQWVLGQN